MTIKLFTRIKSWFTFDKYSFWFDHFTDEEKKLKRMDVWQLAAVIHEASVNPEMEQKSIVAKHMLNVRLSRIQAKPAYIAIFAGIAGVVGGAFLTPALQPSKEPSQCVCEYQYDKTVEKDTSVSVPFVRKSTDVLN